MSNSAPWHITRDEAVEALLAVSERLNDNTEAEEDRIKYANRLIVRIAKGLMTTRFKIKEEVL